MKQAKLLLLSLVLVLAASTGARADGVDVKVKGEWDFSFGWTGNLGFTNSVHGDAFETGDDPAFAQQRIRTQIDFIISENLSAVYGVQVGIIDWGRSNGGVGVDSGGQMDADGVNLATHLAYLDWMIPSTDIQVRMGIQGIALPSTPMGTPVLDSQVAGIVISTPLTDWLGLTAMWLRPYDAYAGDAAGANPRFDEMDIFGLVLPIDIEDAGLKITPWFLYSLVGAGSGYYDYLFGGDAANTVGVDPVDASGGASLADTSSARGSRTSVFWIGTHLEFSLLDPLVFNVEAIYGKLRQTDVTGLFGYDEDAAELIVPSGYRLGTSGWFIGATLDYTLEIGEDFSMTPGIFGWWASGDSASAYDTGKLGRLPTLSQGNAGFAPTTFGAAGTFSIGRDTAVTATGLGTWGIGIQLAEISFIEDLTHTLRFAYYKGTNSSAGVRDNGNESVFLYGSDTLYLTDKDHVFEVNFDHSYAIYENLTAVLELGWLHLSADGDTWRNDDRRDAKTGQNAWKAQLALQFSF
ncbi:MAG: outer membrane homotrimeric porin [Desulfovibrio sp.]|jgi:hypothetical protein|nr:outer membrane homotrimeric porin [Desulfovibrio sp.]